MNQGISLKRRKMTEIPIQLVNQMIHHMRLLPPPPPLLLLLLLLLPQYPSPPVSHPISLPILISSLLSSSLLSVSLVCLLLLSSLLSSLPGISPLSSQRNSMISDKTSLFFNHSLSSLSSALLPTSPSSSGLIPSPSQALLPVS